MKGEVDVNNPNLNVPPRLFDLKTSIKDCGGKLLLYFVNESSINVYQEIYLSTKWFLCQSNGSELIFKDCIWFY